MRILLDECVPRPLKRSLSNHDVYTVPEMSWSGKKNGELIKLVASENFDVFVTVDQNLRYQQKLRTAKISVIVLMALTNRLEDLLPLMPSVHAALTTIQPGDFLEIHA